MLTRHTTHARHVRRKMLPYTAGSPRVGGGREAANRRTTSRCPSTTPHPACTACCRRSRAHTHTRRCEPAERREERVHPTREIKSYMSTPTGIACAATTLALARKSDRVFLLLRVLAEALVHGAPRAAPRAHRPLLLPRRHPLAHAAVALAPLDPRPRPPQPRARAALLVPGSCAPPARSDVSIASAPGTNDACESSVA